jgi:MFS family permease
MKSETEPPQPENSSSNSLWKHSNFLKFWAGRSVSLFGTEISNFALPLTAITVLNAAAYEVGLLRSLRSIAAALTSLFAGVIIDRIRRKPILIATDLGFVLLTGLIPAAYFLGFLSIGQLFIIQFLSGVLSVSSDVSQMAFMPSLIKREQIFEGNSKLQISSSVSTIGGPPAAGVLVQFIGAPLTIILDTLSFLISAFFTYLIKDSDQRPPVSSEPLKMTTAIKQGMRMVFGNKILRPLAEAISAHFLFTSMIYTVFVLYVINELKVESIFLGILFGAFGPGLLLGALAVRKFSGRYGIGTAVLISTCLNALGATLISLAGGSMPVLIVTLSIAHFLIGFGMQIYGISTLSLRQSVVPDDFQGRVNATFRFGNLCALAAGSLIAGFLGDILGLQAILIIAALGLWLIPLRLMKAAIWKIRTI